MKYMNCSCGKDIVAAAAALAVRISEGLSEDELCTLTEFLSLLKSNLDIIRCNRKKCK